jgi:hypothetical protein
MGWGKRYRPRGFGSHDRSQNVHGDCAARNQGEGDKGVQRGTVDKVARIRGAEDRRRKEP